VASSLFRRASTPSLRGGDVEFDEKEAANTRPCLVLGMGQNRAAYARRRCPREVFRYFQFSCGHVRVSCGHVLREVGNQLRVGVDTAAFAVKRHLFPRAV